MSFRVKKNDNVVVITGQEKGKSGRVLFVNTDKNYVKVENVNMVSRHKKGRNAQEKSGITKMEGNIHISNVMLLCPECKDATRIKAEQRDGVKRRVCRHCGAVIETKIDKKADKTKRKEREKSSDSRVKRTKKSEQTQQVEEAAEATPKKTVKRTKKSEQEG